LKKKKKFENSNFLRNRLDIVSPSRGRREKKALNTEKRNEEKEKARGLENVSTVST
jgi:hypothetical protein